MICCKKWFGYTAAINSQPQKKDLTRSCDSSDKVLYRISTMPVLLRIQFCHLSFVRWKLWVFGSALRFQRKQYFAHVGHIPHVFGLIFGHHVGLIQSNDFIAFCIKNTRQLCKVLCFRLEPSEGFDRQPAAYKASALPLSHDGKYIIFVTPRKWCRVFYSIASNISGG